MPKPRKNKMRPIDTPTQEDRIVQEAIRGILEAIYEPEFCAFEKLNNYRCTNFGFRPGKSTWNAIETLYQKAQSSTYSIEGDIVSAYNNVDHDILHNISKRRIKDSKFLLVIKNMLKSGIMNRESYENTITGTPQGGIVSPLLFNIYMFELDNYIYNDIIAPIIKKDKTKKRVQNPEWKNLKYKITKLKNKHKETFNFNYKKDIKKLIKQRMSIPSYQPRSIPQRPLYIRYADDWVLTIAGSFEQTIKLKQQISRYVNDNLKMELD
uniref:Reverse transcriptase domain-containing protein n=1 Tax=Blidingia minima TaxID=63414 RepID=A0A8E5J5N3_9CHLO|nr:hypothetical protein [Blidingia minima]QUX32896.1 hypothetical protein [Blidingia minima]